MANVLKLVLFYVLPLLVVGMDPELETKIDDYITTNFLPSNNIPALTIAVTSGNGSVSYSKGFGTIDEGNLVPTTDQTGFLMGSISKSFAAVVVVKVLNEKFPNDSNVLDKPVAQLAPDFNFTLNDRFRTEQVSFRDLLAHRVCSKSDGMATVIFMPFQSSQEVAYRQRYAPEGCGFRTSMIYNNALYTLTSEAIGHISGRSYQDLLADLFTDIGMTNSSYLRATDPDEVPGRATAFYLKNGQRLKYNPKLLRSVVHATAAGGVVSTAADMAKYLQFHLNKGKVVGRQVVPEAAMNWLYEPANLLVEDGAIQYKPNRADIDFGNALGIRVGSSEGWQKIWHPGSVPPFVSWLSFYPALDFGIISATNQLPMNLSLHHAHLHNAVLDIMTGKEPTILHQNQGSPETKKEVKPKSQGQNLKFGSGLRQVPITNFTGHYGSGLYGELEISLKQRNDTNSTSLYMNYGLWGQAYLLETSNESKFQLQWDSDIDQFMITQEQNPAEFYAVFSAEGTKFQINYMDFVSISTFEKDVSLETLPVIPWSPESCRPEENSGGGATTNFPILLTILLSSTVLTLLKNTCIIFN